MSTVGWEYETIRVGPAEDIDAVLHGYEKRGFSILHRHYVPGGCYHFLLGKPEFAWFHS